jgi:predicted AlkP superfamily pyrophosphatase or phosphodiesterase
VAALSLLAGSGAARVSITAASRAPRLVVLLVVDQMRADYVDRFGGEWQAGLERLVSTGARFRLAEYPYANTVTCAGHSTISTGTLPSTHGMILNSWFDRSTGKNTTCTEDGSVTNIGYGRPVQGGDSLVHMRTSTLADELRAQLDPPGHALAVSLKARSAATLGGHRPDAVAWFDDSGVWTTSTAFSKAPVPVLSAFMSAHPVGQDFGKTWERLRPLSAYQFEPSAVGVSAPEGMTAAFPHELRGASDHPDATFYQQWQSSPYSDEYAATMALATARALKFDSIGSTNLLAISFSALDKVGHDFGPNSHEIQDVLLRLDRTLGTLFDGLDAFVGADNYVVALSADHGVPPIPERAVAEGLPAGRTSVSDIVAVIEKSLSADFGAGPHVNKYVHTEAYLHQEVAGRLAKSPDAVAHLRAALGAVPGVAGLFTAAELESTPSGDPSIRGRYARSHVPGRSGDVTVVYAPYWIDDKTGTSHGTPYSYDARVPIFLMGFGIRAGEYLTTASPVDIAPTLAFLAGVTLPHTDGRVLKEALRQ